MKYPVIFKEAALADVCFKDASVSEANDVEQSIVGWGSKPTVDRDKELIEANAWQLDNFRKNPVLLLCHKYDAPPVGKVLWVKSDTNGLKFKARFANTERGKEIYQLYKDGIMNAFSVGFKPLPGGVIDAPKDVKYKGCKRVFTGVELMEISCVPVPANSDALVEYVKSGKIQTKELNEELELIIDIVTDVETKTDSEDVDGTKGADEIVESEMIEQDADGDRLEEKADLQDGVVTQPDNLSLPDFLKKEFPDREFPFTSAEEFIEFVDKAAETASTEKTADSDGNPSMYDLVSAISAVLNPTNKNNYGPEIPVDPSYSYKSVVDVYPFRFPSGRVVYSTYDSETRQYKYYQVDYLYDMGSRTVTIPYVPQEVLSSWVLEQYGQKMVDDVEEDIEIKSGRMISAKNRVILQSAIDIISGLIKDDEPEEGDDEDEEGKSADAGENSDEEIEEKEQGEIIILEDSPEDFIEFKEDSNQEDQIEFDENMLAEVIAGTIMKTAPKIDVKGVVMETVAKLRGKATL